MADNSMGWLDRVVDFNFNSAWVGIYAQITINLPNDASYDTSFTLPNQSGGTPGWDLLTGNAYPGTYRQSPYRVTAADINRDFRLDAGLGLKGFGVKGFFQANPGTINVQSMQFFKLTSQFAQSFEVRMFVEGSDGSGSGGSGQVSVMTFKQGIIKAGRLINSSILGLPHDQRNGSWSSPLSGVPFRYRVNPENLSMFDITSNY